MKKYKITVGNGSAWVDTYDIEVEEWECEQDAVDSLIDTLQAEKKYGCFIWVKSEDEEGKIIDTEGHEYFQEEYIIGGNSGLYLYHGGTFRIEEV